VAFALQGYADFELAGQGGLGRVYRARRVSTGGMVAIKELLEISAGSPTWHRARRELDALLRLKGHPHVVNVEEVVDGPAGPCLVMEYAPGGSLFDRVQRGPLSAAELVLVGQHVCDALTASHAVGVIHRDIKPHNLLIGAFGQVKVCDFGIASLARDGEARTKTGSLTMAYASPEELDGSDDIGPPADAYSFAATMLHLASGRRPSFRDRVDATAADFAVNDDALAPTIAVLRQALAHHPSDRSTLAELSASFDEAATRLGSLRIKVLQHVHPPHAVPLSGVPQPQIPAPSVLSPTSVASTKPRSVINPPPTYDAVSATTIMRPPPPPAVVPVVPQPIIRSTTPSVTLVVGLALVGALVIAAVLFASGRDSNDASNDASPVATASATTQADVETSTPSNTDRAASEDTQPTANTVRQVSMPVSVSKCTYLAPVDVLPWGTCTKGPAVQLMQNRLFDLGYYLDPDGLFGPETERAVKNFQNNAGLVVDGIVGFATWTALFDGVNLPGFDHDGDGVLEPGEIFYDDV